MAADESAWGHGERFLTDVSSVDEFYSLPKKQIKPSGKLPSTPFEAFDMSVYKEKAHFNAFRSSPNRLPYWILASYKIAYEYLGKDDNYFIGWNDKVDDHDEFDHIVCKFYDELNLTVTLRICFKIKTSCLTIQGGGYIWFIEEIFPRIQASFQSLLAESHPDTPTPQMVTKNKQQRQSPSQIPLPISPISPRKSHDLASTNLQQSNAVKLADIESKTVEILKIIDKFDINKALKDLETSQKNLDKRLGKIETLLAKPSSNGGKAKGTIPVESIDNNSLTAKLESLESLISRANTQPRSGTTDLSYKDNQIDLLISEVSTKNKETGKLKKENSSLLQKLKTQDNMINYERELKDCIIVLEEKMTMIKDLGEKNYDLERESKKLRSQLEEVSELEKNVLILNKELEASNRICCNLENQKEELLSENKTL